MNKVIMGKRYDTDTATELGSWSHGYRGDFDFCEETLYRKRTGEFFLYGEGGAMSKYCELVAQNEWSGGEQIIPLDFAEAQDWAEKYLDGDEYEQIFGEVGDDGEKVRMCLSVKAKTEDALKKLAVERKISVSEMVDKMLADWERKKN